MRIAAPTEKCDQKVVAPVAFSPRRLLFLKSPAAMVKTVYIVSLLVLLCAFVCEDELTLVS